MSNKLFPSPFFKPLEPVKRTKSMSFAHGNIDSSVFEGYVENIQSESDDSSEFTSDEEFQFESASVEEVYREKTCESEPDASFDEDPKLSHFRELCEKDIAAVSGLAKDIKSVLSNVDEIDGFQDEPEFYDEHADSEDERITEEFLRHKIENGSAPSSSGNDIQLCCPNCFSILCLDCQQHETQKHLFRAIFVFNCKASLENNFKDESQEPAVDLKGVSCISCDTIVGVKDDESVYEFFNVLPSNL